MISTKRLNKLRHKSANLTKKRCLNVNISSFYLSFFSIHLPMHVRFYLSVYSFFFFFVSFPYFFFLFFFLDSLSTAAIVLHLLIGYWAYALTL